MTCKMIYAALVEYKCKLTAVDELDSRRAEDNLHVFPRFVCVHRVLGHREPIPKLGHFALFVPLLLP